jgi:hypothetical protein
MEKEVPFQNLIPLESYLYFPNGEEQIFSSKKGQRVRRIFEGPTLYEKQERDHLDKIKPALEAEALNFPGKKSLKSVGYQEFRKQTQLF